MLRNLWFCKWGHLGFRDHLERSDFKTSVDSPVNKTGITQWLYKRCKRTLIHKDTTNKVCQGSNECKMLNKYKSRLNTGRSYN